MHWSKSSNFLQNFYPLFPFILDLVNSECKHVPRSLLLNSVSVNMFHVPWWPIMHGSNFLQNFYPLFPFILGLIKGKFGSAFWNGLFEKVGVSKSAVWNWVYLLNYLLYLTLVSLFLMGRTKRILTERHK